MARFFRIAHAQSEKRNQHYFNFCPVGHPLVCSKEAALLESLLARLSSACALCLQANLFTLLGFREDSVRRFF